MEIPALKAREAPVDIVVRWRHHSYTFAIVDTRTISVASEKEYAPGGIEIAPGSEHEAYVYSTSGQFDVVMAYRLNENWTLLIENSGGLKDRMTLDEIEKAFYGLVTPVL